MALASQLQFGPHTNRQLGITNAAITAAGTTNADATVMSAQVTFYTLTATGSDGIKLASDTPLFTPIYIYNSSGSTGLLYPGTSISLNGGTATTGTISLVTLKCAIVIRNTATNYVVIFDA